MVVGASGQLGARCCEQLLAGGRSVVGMVRAPERARDLAASGVELVRADLAADDSLVPALQGVETLIVTANSAAPRGGDDPEAVQRGLLRLTEDARTAGVRRVVLVSVPETAYDSSSPVFRGKRALEARLRGASYEHVILRFPPFMEAWLALVGSSIPLRGEKHATIGRPSPFLQSFRKATGSLVEHRGVMLVPGSGRIRNAFITVDDVAHACVEAVVRPDAANNTYEIGGPEVLSWSDVAGIYGDVLGRRVRVLATPAPVYAVAAKALAPFSAVASGTMTLNRVIGAAEAPYEPGGGLVDPGSLTTVREFLERKVALPGELPVVA
jgi:uncharacterized protein YbjT (DUF2867 family)